MLERDFQAGVIRDLKKRFPGCMVFKLDPDYIQGSPDLLVLHGKKWATLECKKERTASKRPNQEYYVEKMNDMSFSRFIFPENKEEVLNELQRAFGGSRKTRTVQSKSAVLDKQKRRRKS